MVERYNGKTGETVRFAIGLIVAGLVAYFTTTSAIQTEVSAIKARQESQFSELLRRLEVMQADIREIRK